MSLFILFIIYFINKMGELKQDLVFFILFIIYLIDNKMGTRMKKVKKENNFYIIFGHFYSAKKII